jgi:hypothetical protein
MAAAAVKLTDRRMLGAFAAVALPTLGVAILTSWLALVEHDRHAHEELNATTRSVAAALDLKLESYKAAILTLSNSDELRTVSTDRLPPGEAERVADAFGGSVAIA